MAKTPSKKSAKALCRVETTTVASRPRLKALDHASRVASRIPQTATPTQAPKKTDAKKKKKAKESRGSGAERRRARGPIEGRGAVTAATTDR